MALSQLSLGILMLTVTIEIIYSSSDACDQHFSLRGPELAALVNRTYPSCDQMDLSVGPRICQINCESKVDMCHANYGTLLALTTACPDGTWNRTCYPIELSTDMTHMNCICHSAVVVRNTDNARETNWEKWQAHGANFRRRLMMDTECIGQEFAILPVPLKPIVATYDLPDSIFTASTYHGANHEQFRARIDKYNDYVCAWVPKTTETNHWLAIKLPTVYLIKGMLFKKRCDVGFETQYVTMVTVSTSADDVTYQDVVTNEDLSNGYDADDTAYITFAQVHFTRFWIIHVIAWNHHAAMKCDLLGIQ